MLASGTFPSQRVGSLEKWNACSSWHFTFYLLFCDTCICWVSQEKMRKIILLVLYVLSRGVRGSQNKHTLLCLR